MTLIAGTLRRIVLRPHPIIFMQLSGHDYNHPAFHALKKDEEADLEKKLTWYYHKSCQKYAKLPFISYRAGLSANPKHLVDKYIDFTYEQSMVYVAAIIQKLVQTGFQKEDRVIMYAKNSPLWLLTDIAIQFLEGVTAPVYDTLGIDNIIYCTNLVGAKYIVVSGDYLANVVGIAHLIPTVKHIVTFDDYTEDHDKVLQLAMKIYLVNKDGDVIRDDTNSMYSMFSTTGTTNEGQAETPASKLSHVVETEVQHDIVDLLMNKRNNQLEITILNEFPAISDAGHQENAKRLLEEYLKASTQTADDPITVIFTSGTSGRPKGAILTHRNINAGMHCSGHRQKPYHLNRAGEQASLIAYLPLAHAFERAEEHGAIIRGWRIYFGSGNIKLLSREIQMARPSMMIGVPRVYAKIYQAVMQKLAKQPLIIRMIFKAAYMTKKLYLRVHPAAYATGRMPVVDRVFKQIIAGFGGRMEFVVSGSSTMPSDVREFLQVCSGAQLSIGYGMTETSCTGAYNHAGTVYYEQGEIGHASYLTTTKLVDASDRCEYSLEKDGIGELCIKGPGVALGYVDGEWGKIKGITDGDGYYHTGDLGKLMPDRSGSFVRRINFVVKLQQGEFVDLERIEGVLEADPMVSIALVHAEPDKSAPVCLVNLDSTVLRSRVGQDIIDQYNAGNHGPLEEYVQTTCDNLIRGAGLKAFNIPRAYHVELDQEWLENHSLFTPTQKKKRSSFAQYYHTEIQKLWDVVGTRDGASVTVAHTVTKARLCNLWQLILIVAVFFLAFAAYLKK